MLRKPEKTSLFVVITFHKSKENSNPDSVHDPSPLQKYEWL